MVAEQGLAAGLRRAGSLGVAEACGFRQTAAPPMAKGMRQAQRSKSSSDTLACKASNTPKAVSCPAISVTHWELE
jgi:hypothetical protein